jgi:amidase
MSAPHYISAVDAIAQFRSRRLSPVELVRALLARRDQFEPSIRAFTNSFDERALAAARDAEQRYREGSARALEGIPIGIKDVHAMSGEITTHGSLVFRDNRDETTTPTVQRLLDAGAIVLARTTSPEFGSSTITQSRLWGATRNPWNLAATAGGSSGGAAAALAAGTLTLADGSDYGGSIRIPASCCGVIGFKPPYGRNPTEGLDPFSHLGPLARTVGDVVVMQNVMSGPSATDVWTLPRAPLTTPSRRDLVGVRIAWSMDLDYIAVDADVRAATLAALDLLRSLGATVVPVELGWTARIREAYELHHAAADAALLWMLLPSQRELLTDYVIDEIERGNRISARELFATHDVRMDMYRTLGPILAAHDAFVCPTTAIAAVAAEQSPLATIEIDGRTVPAHRGWVMTYPFNMLSPLPVLSVPSGRARNGVPIGLQIVGRPFDEQPIFEIANAFEGARGPWFVDDATSPVPPPSADPERLTGSYVLGSS